MKYRRTLVAALVFSTAAIAPLPSVADAAIERFEGEVIDYGGAPVAGIEVTVIELDATIPSGTAITDANGLWVIDVDTVAEEFLILFDSDDYQSGYRGCGPYVYPDLGWACTLRPGYYQTYVVPSYVSGRILDSATSAPVAGAVVSVFREDGTTFISSASTAPDGTYRVNGVTGEEIGIQVDGTAVGYGSGWFACAPGVVVPTFGDACTHLPGPDGDRYLDALSEAPRFRLRSRDPGAITLIVRDPGTDLAVLGYELTCRSRLTGETTAAVFEASGETRDGFDRGINRCHLQVLTAMAAGPDSEPRNVRVR